MFWIGFREGYIGEYILSEPYSTANEALDARVWYKSNGYNVTIWFVANSREEAKIELKKKHISVL
ncbi:MAG: hypothetical protein IH840_00470 [Candidatus Heimdallarchaeota archaeon]|nr:hypothetical protein [Candidatus Heimdallarchaeota archaeon]